MSKYSESLKRAIVDRCVNGEESCRSAGRPYGIDHSTVCETGSATQLFLKILRASRHFRRRRSAPMSPTFLSKLGEFDGFIATVAEYSSGPTAALKNALDSAPNEWARKPIAFMGYGGLGGARAIDHLKDNHSWTLACQHTVP